MEFYEPKAKKVQPSKAERILMRSFHSNVKASFGPSSEKPSKMTEKGPQSYDSGAKFIDDVKTIKSKGKVGLESSSDTQRSKKVAQIKADDVYTPTLKNKGQISPNNSATNVGSYEKP